MTLCNEVVFHLLISEFSEVKIHHKTWKILENKEIQEWEGVEKSGLVQIYKRLGSEVTFSLYVFMRHNICVRAIFFPNPNNTHAGLRGEYGTRLTNKPPFPEQYDLISC